MANSSDIYIKRIINELKKIDYIKPGEIPNIDLYMDQVTTFMDEHLSMSKRYDDDKMLTKTMINNYTKNNLLPSPNKKKYSKEHMLLLIFIYYFKSFLSISDIQSIFTPLIEKFYTNKSEVDLEDIYSGIFDFVRDQIEPLTKDVIRKYTKAQQTFPEVEDKEDREFLNTFSCVCMLSFDVYVKKMIIERIIDQEISNMRTKPNATKEAAQKVAKEKGNVEKEKTPKEKGSVDKDKTAKEKAAKAAKAQKAAKEREAKALKAQQEAKEKVAKLEREAKEKIQKAEREAKVLSEQAELLKQQALKLEQEALEAESNATKEREEDEFINMKLQPE